TQRPNPFPRAPVGVALAAATVPAPGGLNVTLFAAGGAEPLGGDSAFIPDSGVYAAGVAAGGGPGAWVRQIDLPVRRAFAAGALGRPQRGVYVGRIAPDGQIDGWYTEPELAAARAYGGGVVLDSRAIVFGGLQDSAPPGGGLDSTPARLATADTVAVSLVSGFLTGTWAPAAPALPAGRSQFATLDRKSVVLVVGGRYAGDTAGTAETLAATIRGDTLATFAAVSGVTAISAQGGGILVGPAGAAWRDADGTAHGLVLGGFDLQTRQRKAGVWGF